jgi:hypothetical protein
MAEFSDNLKINVNAHMALETPIVLLEITHPQLSQTIRLVQDNQDIVSNGNSYVAMSFNLKRQADIQGELPKVTLTVQNIGRSLVKWIDQSGGGKDAVVLAKIVRRSDPDVIEETITLGVERVSITMLSVVFSLVVYNNLAKRGIKISYTANRFPGLF